MIRCFVTLAVLLSSFFLFAMSSSPKEEPKTTDLLGPKVEVQSGVGFITLDELHRIAINYYKYMFDEEHEWKGMKRKEGESIIRSIIPYKADNLTIAYMVNFIPDGHALISAHKNTSGVVLENGSGTSYSGEKEGFLSIYDKRLTPMHSGTYERIVTKYKQNKSTMTDLDRSMWKKLNVPIDSFKERYNFDDWAIPPDWWLEKKKSKNTQGMIKTEWHQKFPFYGFCPVTSDTTLVGCGPLAMAQLLKFYEYPSSGLAHTYDWANMLAYDSLMVTQTQRDAVARICRDTGISVGATYGVSATTSGIDYIADGLARDFNYTSQMITPAAWYSPSSTAIWIDSLKASINRGQPVLYGGLFYFNSQMVDHAWIIDNYNSTQFHFNLGSEEIFRNDWYLASENITLDQNAIYYALPDKNENALSIPYKEDFQEVVAGTNIFQIPKNIGVSHTVKQDGTRTFWTYLDNLNNKSIIVRNSDNDEQWFVLKKTNLSCDSVPVLKFKLKICDEYGLVGSGSTAVIVEVSNDNRVTWNQVYKLDKNNYQPDNFNKFVDNIISLYDFKNQTVNIRFRFPYSGSSSLCLIDDIEIGDLLLSFPELTNDMTLSPKTAQSIKVTPSIATPPKSKGFENYNLIMDFYVKEDIEEAEYSLFYSDSVLEDGVFEFPDLNTDNFFGKEIKVRAVARAKSSLTTLTSTEISLKISGRQCRIDLPLPATESWFDFERRLYSTGTILAEPSFADSLNNVLVYFDIYDDYWSQAYSDYYGYQINISIYDPLYKANYICDSTAYIWDQSKKSGSRKYRPEKLVPLDSKNKFNTKKFIEVSSSQDIKSDTGSKDITEYPVYTYRYPTSLDLYPGTYTVVFTAIRKDLYLADGTFSEMAKYDSLQFIIPQWKLKLYQDYWAQNTVPYTQIKQYEKTKTLNMMIWHPWESEFNPLYLDVIRETDNLAVQSYNIDGTVTDLGWQTTSETVPGFYNLKADNIDYYTNINVTQ